MRDLPPRLLALITECKAQPDDDAPRLVLADWLQEHGSTDAEQARGEFILLQCRLDSLGEDDPRRKGLAARERALLRTHESEWLGPWVGTVEDRRWRRGFARASVVGAGWVRGPLLRPDAWAWLDALSVRRLRKAHLPRLTRAAGLAHVTEFRLRSYAPGDSGARTLAECPHLASLRSLEIRWGNLGPDGARALAKSPHLAGLTSLDLGFNNLGPEGTRALARSPHLARLEYLGLVGCEMGFEGARALAGSPHLARLRRLPLGAGFEPPEAREVLKQRFGDAVSF